MTKTKEELNELKTELESLTKKLQELSEDELKEIAGGREPVEGENVRGGKAITGGY